MRRHRLLVVVPACLLLVAGCGSSGSSGSSGSGDSGSSANKTSTSSGSSAAGLPDACTVVTPAMVEKYFGVTVTAGKASPNYMGGKHCVLSSADGSNTFEVETSPNPDDTIADETYAGSEPVKLTGPGITRGAANLPSDVYVVKGKVGVLVEIDTADQEKDPKDQGLGFGNAIGANF